MRIGQKGCQLLFRPVRILGHVEKTRQGNTGGDGLIVREENRDDRRARLIRLTEKAKNLEDDATAAAEAVNAKALSDLSEAERRAFNAMMTRIIAALKN